MNDKLKCWQPFNDRIRHLRLHMQFIDASICLAEDTAKQKPETLPLKKVLNKPNYSALNEKNTISNRQRIIAFSRSKLHERVIIDVYKYFSDFISQTIREIIDRNPKLFLSDLNSQKQRDISFADIIRLGSYNAIFDEMSKRVYRGLEKEQSTKKLLQRFIKVCKINVPSSELNNTLLYLEIRHLIIHNNGKADDSFKVLNSSKKIKLDRYGYIKMNYKLTSEAILTIYKLAVAIRNQLETKFQTGVI